ncbi:EthD family reductase [Nocardia pseudobrasiliensis]|uniref:Uncharacterized protein (TIGR02118 family) n=1 Tax=Nocardia pseudobrasiliensis TaxID=45979 RepID=A0A370ID74_9NOCA|nr:EthD family reductase [Nocardia pseudobrasiliensis]RDI68071.1 uncharacterized protein (TIGR02118 family) [Nocardia pseudobrasiliensis]
MFRIAVCYGQPADPAAFDEYYSATHAPIALKVPGLTKLTAGKCKSLGRAPAPYYMIASLYFDSADALEAALKSPEMDAAGADVANFATGGVTIFTQREEVILG